MPSIATGADAANRELTYIGISGDGDSLSIGIGQLAHAVRRNVDMVYVIENNGVYGLTKGQFSASADVGSKSKRGEANRFAPIDPCALALDLGATFVARSFSGDKAQLVPILKAALSHRGFALIDVISPCVTFNDHEGSTKSYLHTRKHLLKVVQADFVPPAQEITAQYEEGTTITVTLHDGSTVRLRKLAPDYDPSDRAARHRAARAPPPARRGRDRPAVRREARRRHARHQRHHRRAAVASSRTRSSAPARPSSTSSSKPSAKRGGGPSP